MKYRLKKEKNYRKMYECRELSIRVYKYLYHNRNLDSRLRFKASNKLSELNFIGGVSRLNNYCILTGRSKGVLSEFGVSRIMLRELFSGGKVYGVIKSSW